MLRAPLIVVPPPVLRQDWESISRLAFNRIKPLDLDACLIPTFIRRFCGATDKLKSAWLWGTTQETVFVGFETQTGKASTLVLRLNQETRAPLLHVHGTDCTQRHPIARSPSIWHVLDHPRSSTPGLLLLPWSSLLPAMSHLLPAYHETSKRDSSHETTIKVKLPKYFGFKFKS
jgi:hypothetical protein